MRRVSMVANRCFAAVKVGCETVAFGQVAGLAMVLRRMWWRVCAGARLLVSADGLATSVQRQACANMRSLVPWSAGHRRGRRRASVRLSHLRVPARGKRPAPSTGEGLR